MDNQHLYEDLSDGQRMELDWQAEQRAEARFLRETYTDWQEVNECGAQLPADPRQLNLFEEDIQ